jgi:diacylglycerol kinase (ATP)
MAVAEFRKQFPSLFVSSLINKAWYFIMGFKTLVQFNQRNDLSKHCQLRCDGQLVEIPPGTQGIIILNIDSYAGGVKLWRFPGEKWNPISMSDQKFVVVAVYSVAHLGQIKTGISSAKPLAQASSFELQCNTSLPMQIDGEPWIQKPGVVRMSWAGRVKMLLPITVYSHPSPRPSVLSSEYSDHIFYNNYSNLL